MVRIIERAPQEATHNSTKATSELRQWPIKLQLLTPNAPFLKGADIALIADCAGVSYPNLHSKILKHYAVAIGCPKLDNTEAHTSRLAETLEATKPKSLTVVHMEVPCCLGLVYIAQEAINRAGTHIPLKRIQIAISGEIQTEEDITTQ